jgi:hypothetical protein
MKPCTPRQNPGCSGSKQLAQPPLPDEEPCDEARRAKNEMLAWAFVSVTVALIVIAGYLLCAKVSGRAPF